MANLGMLRTTLRKLPQPQLRKHLPVRLASPSELGRPTAATGTVRLTKADVERLAIRGPYHAIEVAATILKLHRAFPGRRLEVIDHDLGKRVDVVDTGPDPAREIREREMRATQMIAAVHRNGSSPKAVLTETTIPGKHGGTLPRYQVTSPAAKV